MTKVTISKIDGVNTAKATVVFDLGEVHQNKTSVDSNDVMGVEKVK